MRRNAGEKRQLVNAHLEQQPQGFFDVLPRPTNVGRDQSIQSRLPADDPRNHLPRQPAILRTEFRPRRFRSEGLGHKFPRPPVSLQNQKRHLPRRRRRRAGDKLRSPCWSLTFSHLLAFCHLAVIAVWLPPGEPHGPRASTLTQLGEVRTMAVFHQPIPRRRFPP